MLNNMRIVLPDWTIGNVFFAAACTAFNVFLWRRTAMHYLKRIGDAQDTVYKSAAPSYAAMQTEAVSKEPVDPLRRIYQDAMRLAETYSRGATFSRADAQRVPGWSTYRWNQARWALRNADVLDDAGNMMMDLDDAREALLEWRLHQAELRRAGLFVPPR